MFSIICWSLVLSLIINGVLFLLAFRFKSDKLTDASYAISFIALALFAFLKSQRTSYITVGVVLVCIWATRIGSFLLYRVLRAGSDHRFDGMRENFWRFGKFWLGQALTVWILMLPITLLSSGKSQWHSFALIGVAAWLTGFVLESVADFQKYRFAQNPANKKQWIESGLWYYSRHPNYFGEILVWIGIYLYAFPGLSLASKLVSIVSPLLITTLLLFVSGIPILEKSADKRWGSEPAYKVYKHRTSILIPLPKKRA